MFYHSSFVPLISIIITYLGLTHRRLFPEDLPQFLEGLKWRIVDPEPKSILTPDHIIPLSQKGPNTIDNIQPLCLNCNSSKGTKTIDYRAHNEAGKG